MSQGELFTQIVERGSFSEADAREIIHQILDGLHYLHENGIVHRDLKPENLLCSDNGSVVISDFGLSKFFERGQLLHTRCGTIGYTAPEIVLGESYSPKVDLWAVGVVTYILLSGIAPFFGHEHQVFEQISRCDYDFPTQYFGHISDSGATVPSLRPLELTAHTYQLWSLSNPSYNQQTYDLMQMKPCYYPG